VGEIGGASACHGRAAAFTLICAALLAALGILALIPPSGPAGLYFIRGQYRHRKRRRPEVRLPNHVGSPKFQWNLPSLALASHFTTARQPKRQDRRHRRMCQWQRRLRYQQTLGVPWSEALGIYLSLLAEPSYFTGLAPSHRR